MFSSYLEGENDAKYDYVKAANFIWIIFFIATLFLMIVMLNLLIAFIGDSYDDVLSKKDASA